MKKPFKARHWLLISGLLAFGACEPKDNCENCSFSEYTRDPSVMIINPHLGKPYPSIIGTRDWQYHPDSVRIVDANFGTYVVPLGRSEVDTTSFLIPRLHILHMEGDHPRYDRWREFYIYLGSQDIDTLGFNYREKFTEDGRRYYELRAMYNHREMPDMYEYSENGVVIPKFDSPMPNAN